MEYFLPQGSASSLPAQDFLRWLQAAFITRSRQAGLDHARQKARKQNREHRIRLPRIENQIPNLNLMSGWPTLAHYAISVSFVNRLRVGPRKGWLEGTICSRFALARAEQAAVAQPAGTFLSVFWRVTHEPRECRRNLVYS